METDIWFPFYYGDYLKDTMQLSAERHGIYLLLMIHCWQNEYIEDDIESISMIAKVQSDNKSLIYILDKYFVKKGDRYYQSRITKELKCAKENKIKRTEKAKKAADARWNNNATSNAKSIPTSNATTDAKVVPNPCPSSSSSSSQLPIPVKSKNKSRFTPDFSFIENVEMSLCFEMWCKGKSKKYTNNIQVESGYKKLVKLSGNNPKVATEIIENSLANNWTGLFELKSKGSYKVKDNKTISNFDRGRLIIEE